MEEILCNENSVEAGLFEEQFLPIGSKFFRKTKSRFFMSRHNYKARYRFGRIARLNGAQGHR